MRTCPECSNPLDDQAVFCDNCGLPLTDNSDPVLFVTGALTPGRGTNRPEVDASHPSLGKPQAGTCSACGYVNVPGEMFCQNCGVQLSPVASIPPPPPTPVTPAVNGMIGDIDGSSEPCDTCGFENLSGEIFCSNCGAQLEFPESQMMPDHSIHGVCPGCGSKNPPSVEFCINCGYQLVDTTVSEDRVEKPKPVKTDDSSCSFCGHPRAQGEVFCDHCGMQYLSGSADTTSAQATTADPVISPVDQGVSSAVVCSSCGTARTADEQFCNNCGLQFPSSQVGEALTVSPADSSAKAIDNTIVSGRLIVQTTREEIKLPDGKNEIYIGRSDPVRGIFPDVDLSSFGAASAGVSRRHIRISHTGAQLFIEDLNSTNFSYLNRRRLEPNQRYPLSDGDEIRLGLFVLEFRSN